MHSTQLTNNQLLFNLDAPPRTENMMFKSHQPKPLIIEKLGGNRDGFSSSMRVSQSLQFSAVSEDSLNMAVRLAKRDLKKQKEQIKAGKPTTKAATRVHSPVTKARVLQGKAQSRQIKQKQSQSKGAAVKSKAMLRDKTPPRSTLRHNADTSSLPAMTNSPPTRDVSTRAPLTGDEKIMHEIKRLRFEMEKCMKQIRDIQATARKEPPPPSSKASKHYEDIEAARKRKARAEENTSRSSRMIYVLNQQVKNIQGDLDRMQRAAGAAKPLKKSQTLSKLAAAHRGTVKVLQTFVSHLPDYDLALGMPRCYQEIGLLLRQLSLCCSQLEISHAHSRADTPDDVMKLIQEMADLNRILDSGFNGAVSADPTHNDPIPQQPMKSHPVTKQKKQSHMSAGKKGVDFAADYHANDISNGDAFVVEKIPSDTKVRTRDTGTDPCTPRETALRRGIESLLHAADSAPSTTPRGRSPARDVPRLQLTPRDGATTKTAPPVWQTLMNRNRKIKKGFMLPHHLQRKELQEYPKSILKVERERVQHRLVESGHAHYAQSTHSSRLKEARADDADPAPCDVSIRSGVWTPRDASPAHSARNPSSAPTTPRRSRSREEMSRQMLKDKQRARSEIDFLDKERLHRQKVEDVSFRLGRSPEWVSATERRIRSKIEPLISQAEVEVNADLLSEMILQDMVNDVSQDLHGNNQDKVATNEARVMMDAPDLETVMQRLQQMEEEQLAIRRRWATIVYDDDFDANTRKTYYDAGFCETPGTPQPIQLTRSQPPRGTDPVQGIIDQRINTHMTSDGAIMFTKQQQQPRQQAEHESLQLSRRVPYVGSDPAVQRLRAMTSQHNDPIYLYLTKEIVSSIDENRGKFETYLKKMNFQSVGRFNPKKIVEEIADEILVDCLQEVGRELWEINNDIVEHTYKTEFKDAGLPTSPNKTRPN